MNSKGWLAIAGLGAGVVAAAVMAVAVPAAAWGSDSLVAAATVFLSLVAPTFLPTPAPRSKATDAPAIWLIGPLGVLSTGLLLLSFFGLALGLSGWHTACWVISILWLGSYAVGFSLLNAATQVVASAATQVRSAGDDARAQWMALLRRLALQSDNHEVRRLLEALSERMRFSANERVEQVAPENESISRLLAQIEAALAKDEDVAKLIRSTEALLEQRELTLRSARALA